MNIVLKLMPEYGCYPIWLSKNGDFFENIDPDQLDITTNLKSKIQEWDGAFEKTFDSENPKNSGFKKSDLASFEEKGIEIWSQLILELSEYDIVYKSQINFKDYSNLKIYREQYKYYK